MQQTVAIPLPGATLTGDLTVPRSAAGIVVFAHGSGSGRASPRNRMVAGALQDARLATLLFDLLTPQEERTDAAGRLRFDIGLLAARVEAALAWTAGHASVGAMPAGLFGASTGAAAALVAATRQPDRVAAVVSRGGRPDLAGGDALARVRAPTLLIVGGDDAEVLELNQRALARMTAPARLEVVPGASHLFAEPGALERVSDLARDHFRASLRRRVEGPTPARPRRPGTR